MIDQTKASLLLVEIFIWIFTGSIWHVIYERSGMGLIVCTFSVHNLSWMILYMPQSRLKIRSAFNAYSWIYLVSFGITSFKTGLSSYLQVLHAMNFIEEINFSITPSPYHLHIGFVCAKIINFVYWKLKKYYMTRNVTVEKHQNPNAIIFDDGDCAICLSPHDNASRPHCGHTFCFSCLWSWCHIKFACPICQRPVTTIKVERTPDYDDGDDLRFDTPRLFNFNVDQDLLNHEMFEIVCDTIMFVQNFMSVWIPCIVWVNGVQAAAWISDQAISQ